MPEPHDSPQLLTTQEAAAIARVDVSTVHKWVRRGNLPAVQWEPQIMIDSEALNQFLRQRTPPTQTTARVHDATTDDAGEATRLLATHEAADIAGASVEKVQQWVESGSLRAVHRGWRRLINSGDLERFLRDRKPPAQATSTEYQAATDTAFRDDKPGDLADGMPETHDAPQLLTTQEAADIAGVTVRRVRRWVESGRLRAVHRRPNMLIDREDLERFLQQRTPPPQAAPPELEAATGTAPHDDKPGDLAQGRSGKADEERQGAEGGQDPARLLTRKEAAAIAGIHQSTMGRWARTSKVRTTPDGLIPSSELQRLGYLDSEDTHREEQLELIAVTPHPAPAVSSRPSDSIALLLQERDALRRERDYLLRALDDARDREHRQTALLQGELNAARDRELRLLRLLEAELLPAPTGRRRNTKEDSLPPPTPTPSPQSLSARVLEYLEAQQRPRYAGEIQQALGLSTSPARTLRSLVNRGKARRLKPGLYAALSVPGYVPPGRVQEPAPDTRLGRVLAYVRNATQAGRSVLGWQIQEALGLPERPHRELSKLHAWGFILRVRPGVYLARRPEDET